MTEFLIRLEKLSTTPALAKALATTILEAISGQLKLPNVSQLSKRRKLSHFHAIGSGKQPTKMTSLPSVPEFSHIVVINHLPIQFSFALQDGSLKCCTLLVLNGAQFLIPCKSKLLRKTNKKGGDGPSSSFQVFSGYYSLFACVGGFGTAPSIVTKCRWRATAVRLFVTQPKPLWRGTKLTVIVRTLFLELDGRRRTL